MSKTNNNTEEIVETEEAKSPVSILIKRPRHSDIFICNCGYVEEGAMSCRVSSYYRCPECGNHKVKTMTTRNKHKCSLVSKSKLIPVDKNDYSFTVKKKEEVMSINLDDATFSLSDREELELTFSLKEKEFILKKNGETIEPTEQNINKVFANINNCDIIQAIGTEHNKELYAYVEDSLGQMWDESKPMMGRALSRMFDYPAIEILYNANLKSVLRNTSRSVLASRETKPHQILGAEKYMIPYVREQSVLPYYYYLRDLKSLHNSIGANGTRTLLESYSDEDKLDIMYSSASTIIDLYEEYGYTNVKKLSSYLLLEVKFCQGIVDPREAIRILQDYAKMSTEMGEKFDKYPKSLKREHDLANVRYRANLSEIEERNFMKHVGEEHYQKLRRDTNEKDSYAILLPESSQSLANEGKILNHCVASYTSYVSQGICEIVYMREKNSIDSPLITIEVTRNSIRQAKGNSNRSPNSVEVLFIRKWAEENNLSIDSYDII